MSHLSSTPLIARAILLAGVLLAILALLSPSHFPAYAQEMDGPIMYPENGTHTVAAYTAMDPEGEDITWTLTGDDMGDFSIEGGVLTFNDPPDFENPADDGTNNVYEVTVNANEADDGTTTPTTFDVTVTVTNVEEPGTVKLSALQPKVGFPLTASHADPDDDVDDVTDPTWEWERSPNGSTGWTNIATTTIVDGTITTTTTIVDGTTTTTTTTETIGGGTTATTTTTITTDGTDNVGTPIVTTIAAIGAGTTTATYRPVADDVGNYLRATVTYSDDAISREDDPDTEDVDESLDMASMTSAHEVQAKDYTPAPPVFPDQNPDEDEEEFDQTRKIPENSAPRTHVGAPVTATDRGADGRQEILIYTLDGDDAGAFDIDRATGQLKTKADLDFENKVTYTVTVTATDPGGLPANITVTINVTDVDEDPSITAGAESIVYNENSDVPIGGSNVRYVAKDDEDDDDPDDDKVITWSLSGRNDGSKFEIDATGVLTIKSPPDYEAQDVYNVTVMLTDSDGNTVSRGVTITVNPVEEGHTLTLSNRRPEVGVSIRAVFNSLDDIKTRSSITWEWTTTSQTPIVGATSNTYKPVTDDADSTLSVTAKYLDGHLNLGEEKSVTVSSAFQVLAKDVNEPPKFLDSNNLAINATERMVNENTPGGQNIGDAVDATDNVPSGDDGGLIYTLGGSDGDSFDIDSGTGQLSTKADLDYENPRNTDRRYVVQVTATDPSGAVDNIQVTINVNNLDENPKISGDDPEPYMEDDTGEVARFTAIDPERLPILWELSGTDAEDFSIDGGRLMFENTPDYETPADDNQDNNYEITVHATAGTGANATTTRDVTVTVMNVDEDGEVTLSELQPKEGVSLTAELTDPDGGDGDTLPITAAETNLTSDATWQWARSTNKSSWTDIDEADEDKDKDYTPVADDVGSYLRATATYTDGHGPTNTEDPDKTARVISVKPVLRADYVNTAPVFPDQDPNMEGVQDTAATRSIAENSVPGTAVGDPVTAEDKGSDGEQEVLIYTLAGADASSFDIDRATSQLKTKADLDYEDSNNTDHEYEVEVTATDPSGLADTIAVTITVTDVDEDPSIAEGAAIKITLTEITLTEARTTITRDGIEGNTPLSPTDGAVMLATYEAADDDDDTDDAIKLTWSLSGTDSSKFSISNDTGTLGELTFKGSLNFESPTDSGRNNVYNVTVVVTDSDGDTDSQEVTVEVTNEEEDGTVTLSNLQPEVGIPITATLKDPDDGVTGLTWEWHWEDSETGNDRNIISGATSATYTPLPDNDEKWLRAMATYTDNAMKPEDTPKDDAESVSDFMVQAMADTNDTPQFTDQDPDVDGNQTEREAPENSMTNTGVGDPVTATDTNTEDKLTYTLGGPDAASFTINRETGQISVGAGTKLDYEAKKTYTVTVTATDSSLASDTITVTIKVVDVDEEPVVSKSGLGITGNSSIDHDEDDTSSVETYTAAGQAAAGARWSLGGDDAGDFSISSSGVLTFRSTPDFENPTDQGTNNEYDVMVKATSGAIEASLPVTVTVVNLEEAGAVTLSSNQATVGDELTAVITDLDGGVTGVTWQWARSPNGSTGWTNIEGATSEAYTPVEDDVGNYLQATASYEDGHGPNKSESAATASEVLALTTDVIGNNGIVTLSSNSPVMGQAVTARLADPDSPTGITWQWASSSTAGGTYTDIAGETSATYTPVQGDVGNYLQATASYNDDQGPGQSASAATANAVNAATTTPINRFDSNRDGSIQRDEVIGAIRAFLFDKTATRAEVIEVIRLHLF